MKKISVNILDGKFEHLVDEDNLQITHLQIKKGEEIPNHKSDKSVVVVIYKGKVDFKGERKYEKNKCEYFRRQIWAFGGWG